MPEVRTVSSSGGEKGVKDEAHHLIPRQGLEAIARVFGFGATKYADHNWRKGYEWSKSYAALQRHLVAFWDGETLDAESGLPHLAHAGFHILALLTWLEEQGEGGEFDDRYVRPDPEEDSEDVEAVSRNDDIGDMSSSDDTEKYDGIPLRPFSNLINLGEDFRSPDWTDEVIERLNARIRQQMEADSFRKAYRYFV